MLIGWKGIKEMFRHLINMSSLESVCFNTQIKASKRFYVFTCITLLSSGCATSTKGKTLQAGIIGGLIGGIYGSSRPAFKDQNALMYASIGATIGTTAGLLYYQNEEAEEKLRSDNLKLRNKLDDFERRLNEPFSDIPLSAAESKIPDEYSHLIKPGSVRTYKLNKWEREGKNRLVFKSDAIEIIEPSFKAGKK